MAEMAEMPDATGSAARTEGEAQGGAAIRAGTAVYDASGDQIGTVENAEPGKGYVEVKTGGIMGRALYIPRDAVARVEENGIHLKVAESDLDKLDWYLPPTNGVDLDTPYSPSPWIETGYGQGRRPTPPDDRARDLERDERAGIQPPPPPDLASRQPSHETTDPMPRALAPDANGDAGDGADARGETTIAVPMAEEHLEARIRRDAAGAGTARVRKTVTSERQSLDVPVTHDELRVERVPMDENTAAAHELGPGAFTEQDIDVPLMGEQVELEKRTRVIEQVVLRKRQITEQRRYSGEVRKERVWVEGLDGREIAPDGDTGARDISRDISDEDTITYDRQAQGQDWPEAGRQ